MWRRWRAPPARKFSIFENSAGVSREEAKIPSTLDALVWLPVGEEEDKNIPDSGTVSGCSEGFEAVDAGLADAVNPGDETGTPDSAEAPSNDLSVSDPDSIGFTIEDSLARQTLQYQQLQAEYMSAIMASEGGERSASHPGLYGGSPMSPLTNSIGLGSTPGGGATPELQFYGPEESVSGDEMNLMRPASELFRCSNTSDSQAYNLVNDAGISGGEDYYSSNADISLEYNNTDETSFHGLGNLFTASHKLLRGSCSTESSFGESPRARVAESYPLAQDCASSTPDYLEQSSRHYHGYGGLENAGHHGIPKSPSAKSLVNTSIGQYEHSPEKTQSKAETTPPSPPNSVGSIAIDWMNVEDNGDVMQNGGEAQEEMVQQAAGDLLEDDLSFSHKACYHGEELSATSVGSDQLHRPDTYTSEYNSAGESEEQGWLKSRLQAWLEDMCCNLTSTDVDGLPVNSSFSILERDEYEGGGTAELWLPEREVMMRLEHAKYRKGEQKINRVGGMKRLLRDAGEKTRVRLWAMGKQSVVDLEHLGGNGFVGLFEGRMFF